MDERQKEIFELMDESVKVQIWHDGYCDHYVFWMDIVDIWPDITREKAISYIKKWEKAGRFAIAKKKAHKLWDQEEDYFKKKEKQLKAT